ncbi:hypothetical protein [Dokdonella sp.]|uniref:acyltransferase family protein n=1 Tax=Dokdonella sp. TaxID=2291710 RepID=UPI002CD5B0D6|nr:hypothetical protein [Dokdonella sp.]HPN79993.1 hypothetical protein [Dokdonella sp.]
MRLPGLDLLRIIAGLALMVCHAGFWLGPFGIPDAFWMFLGQVNVELFLVAMGFLVAQDVLTAEHQIGIARHWARSAFRLWPLYLILLAVNLVLVSADDVRPDWLAYPFLAQNLAWPHPPFFGEAWIVAAAAMVLLAAPVLCRVLRPRGFRAGIAVLIGLLLMSTVLRALLVSTGDPVFDVGVRKILIARLDLPLYAVLSAWLWVHRYAAIIRWRGALAMLGGSLLAASAWIHLHVDLDHSSAARNFLLPMSDCAWLLLLPWVCSWQMPDRLCALVRGLAGSAYAGLLTHVTVLRIGALAGLSLVARSPSQGVAMLLSFVLLASGVAILVHRLVDRPLLVLRERWWPIAPEHAVPVTKR